MQKSSLSRFIIMFVIPMLTITIPSISQANKTFTRDGLAIGGYDPVAYHKVSRPVKGLKRFSSEYQDATWHFSSMRNKALFDSDSEKYAPAYGGYCAYAVASGYIADTVPDAWAIHNGRLYLNYSNGVAQRWSKDKDGYISKANKNWPHVLNQ